MYMFIYMKFLMSNDLKLLKYKLVATACRMPEAAWVSKMNTSKIWDSNTNKQSHHTMHNLWFYGLNWCLAER